MRNRKSLVRASGAAGLDAGSPRVTLGLGLGGTGLLQV